MRIVRITTSLGSGLPMTTPWDFDAFLETAKTLRVVELNKYGEDEAYRAENAGRGEAGARNRELGSAEYAMRVREFLYYLRTGQRPQGAGPPDFARYRPVVVALVERGDFLPNALEAFDDATNLSPMAQPFPRN
jgi:hypothetical protein